MAEDKKLIWLVNPVAGARLEQKNALAASGQFRFTELYSDNEAVSKLREGIEKPGLIISSSNILEKMSNIPVINASGMDMKDLQAKVEEKLSSGIYAGSAQGRAR